MSDYLFDERGWLKEVRSVPSPNCDERPQPGADLLVIHAISLPAGIYEGDDVEALFTNTLCTARSPDYADLANLRVSAHFFVRRDGSLTQFVSVDERAWHAGISQFDGRTGCNDFSVGIELEGVDHAPFKDAQYAVLEPLVRALLTRFPSITVQRIAAHSDIAPGRKRDPGPCFDWSRLLGHL
ncbi:MAG: 1,6-anhydro-N-acetylmuramyl-L-alanine amidase AmpD [Pseudomonadota bacterium]